MHKTSRIRFAFCWSDNRESKTRPESYRRIQKRKLVGLSVIALVLVVAGAVATAQQPKKVQRIAYLAARGESHHESKSNSTGLATRA